MTLRGTTVIMADVKSDQVKQSLDNLEKFRLCTEGKLKLFIHREFDLCGSLLRKIMLDGEVYHLLTELPLTVEERNNLVMYSGRFLPVWYRSDFHRMLPDFWYLFGWFHSWFLHFSWTKHSSETVKASNSFVFISLSWNCYQKDSVNRMNDGQANHSMVKSSSESQDLIRVLGHCQPKIRNAILTNVITI